MEMVNMSESQRGRGRPKSTTTRKKKVSLTLTHEEWAEIEASGAKNVAAFLRNMMKENKELEKRVTLKTTEQAPEGDFAKKAWDNLQYWKEQAAKAKDARDRGIQIQQEMAKEYDRRIKKLQNQLESKPRGNTRKFAMMSNALLHRLEFLEEEKNAEEGGKRGLLEGEGYPDTNMNDFHPAALQLLAGVEATLQGYEHEAVFLRSLIDTLRLSSWDMIARHDATYQKLKIETSPRDRF
jgi:hypothetical protein